MQAARPEISTCPDCGRPLEETFGGELGCMACWLGAGISGEEDEQQDSTPDAFEHFGVYKIDRREDGSLYELGHGAMGITYRAMDTTLQRKVALKIIRTAVAGQSKEARESLLRERRATRQRSEIRERQNSSCSLKSTLVAAWAKRPFKSRSRRTVIASVFAIFTSLVR